jgi:cardiolipin synthase
MSVPNLITLGRLLSVPAIVWLIFVGSLSHAFYVFVGAGLSDAVDGFWAKHFNARTRLGAYLDPAADKVLLVSVYIALAINGQLPPWLVFLVAGRDILIFGAVLLSRLFALPVQIEPLWMGKFNTVLQIILAGLVLGKPVFDVDLAALMNGGIYLVAFTTVVSGLAYLMVWLGVIGK